MPKPPLSASLTPLLGRERELADVQRLLSTTRLATITGPGGVGKTSLALQVARELHEAFAEGARFIALGAISDPTLIIPTVAQALGLAESPNRLILDSLKEFLRDRQLLLLLDNFEQIISAAPLLTELLEACAELRMLVTSREALHLRGEHEFPLAPLELSNRALIPGHASVEILLQYPGIALFVQRAQASQPDFQLTADNAAAVAEICARLDGLPLAIELAAVRIKLLPPKTMLARLQESSLQLLTSGARGLPARQQTLRSAIRWSYDLLNDVEQRAFRWLSIFAGGCTIEAASKVIGQQASLDNLFSLVSKNLLRQTEFDGEPRLSMLETIREFGLEQLSSARELDSARRAHAGYYLSFAEDAERELTGADQKNWLQRLDREQDNLRAALHWAIEHHEGEMAQRMVGALWQFWFLRGQWSEGRRWLEEALSMNAPGANDQTFQAKALYGASVLARFQGDFARAQMLGEQSITLYRALGDKEGLLNALLQMGRTLDFQGNESAKGALLTEILTLVEELPDSPVKALAYAEIPVLGRRLVGSEAVRYLAESERINRALNNPSGLAYTMVWQGAVAAFEGDYARASACYDEAERLAAEAGDQRVGLRVPQNRAMLDWLRGDYSSARRNWEESIQLGRNIGDVMLPVSLEVLAAVLQRQGLSPWAARVYGMADAWKGKSQIASAVFTAADAHYGLTDMRAEVRAQLDMRAEVRAQLGEESYAQEWAEGRRMTLDDLLAMPHPRGPSPDSAAQAQTASAFLPLEALTASEIDVLSLLTQDLSDPQIAKSLEDALSFESVAEVNSAVRAKALLGAGTLARFQGDFARARALSDQSVALYRALGDKEGLLNALIQLGRTLRFQGAEDTLETVWNEAAALAEELPDSPVKAHAYSEMVMLKGYLSRPTAETTRYLAESERINRALNNPAGLAYTVLLQATVASFQGDLARASACYDEAKRLAVEAGDQRVGARVPLTRTTLDWQRGDYAAVRKDWEEYLQLAKGLGDVMLPIALQGLAAALQRQGLSHWAARVFGMADAWKEKSQITSPRYNADVEAHLGFAKPRAEVRAQLGEERYAQEWAEGRRMTLDDLLAMPHPRGPSPDSAAQAQTAPMSLQPEPLTAREMDVLRLLAQDLSNPQIAERLVVSRRTVDAHLRSIYEKLGVKSRDAAIRVARERGWIGK
jgi:predicted ATPase/DNA-binding CsgD family transcriptional regulator